MNGRKPGTQANVKVAGFCQENRSMWIKPSLARIGADAILAWSKAVSF